VTAPQGLFLMNSEEVDRGSAAFAARLQKEAGADLGTAVDLGYRIVLARHPSSSEKDEAMTYLHDDPRG